LKTSYDKIYNGFGRNDKTTWQQYATESTEMIQQYDNNKQQNIQKLKKNSITTICNRMDKNDSMTKICNRMDRNDKRVWTQYATDRQKW